MQEGYLSENWQRNVDVDVAALRTHVGEYLVPTHIPCISNTDEYTIMCILEDPRGCDRSTAGSRLLRYFIDKHEV